MKPRPTESEFAEMKRKRDEHNSAVMKAFCEKHGYDPSKTAFHCSNTDGCYCACPGGPCQHTWDGPEWVSKDDCGQSVTCSRCGEVAMFHDMRTGP